MFVDVKGTGPHVVLVHGLGAHHFSWRHTVEELRSDHTTHAVDLLGFGASTAPSGFDNSPEEQADAVIAYLRDSGISNFHLIGHSLGGAVSLFMLDKILSGGDLTIEKLALIAPVAYPPIGTSFAFDIPSIPSIPLYLISAWLAKKVLQRAYFDDDRITAKQIDAYADNISTSERLATFVAHAGKLGNIAALGPKYRSYDQTIKFIWGRQDKVLTLNDFETRPSGDLPNADLAIIDNCGHIPQEERPSETNSVIKAFLSE